MPIKNLLRNPETGTFHLAEVGKGGPELWLRGLIARNHGLLREFLLDGVLVRESILDRAKVERVLSNDVAKTYANATDIFVQLYIEMWAQKWLAITELRAGA